MQWFAALEECGPATFSLFPAGCCVLILHGRIQDSEECGFPHLSAARLISFLCCQISGIQLLRCCHILSVKVRRVFREGEAFDKSNVCSEGFYFCPFPDKLMLCMHKWGVCAFSIVTWYQNGFSMHLSSIS